MATATESPSIRKKTITEETIPAGSLPPLMKYEEFVAHFDSLPLDEQQEWMFFLYRFNRSVGKNELIDKFTTPLTDGEVADMCGGGKYNFLGKQKRNLRYNQDWIIAGPEKEYTPFGASRSRPMPPMEGMDPNVAALLAQSSVQNEQILRMLERMMDRMERANTPATDGGVVNTAMTQAIQILSTGAQEAVKMAVAGVSANSGGALNAVMEKLLLAQCERMMTPVDPLAQLTNTFTALRSIGVNVGGGASKSDTKAEIVGMVGQFALSSLQEWRKIEELRARNASPAENARVINMPARVPAPAMAHPNPATGVSPIPGAQSPAPGRTIPNLSSDAALDQFLIACLRDPALTGADCAQMIYDQIPELVLQLAAFSPELVMEQWIQKRPSLKPMLEHQRCAEFVNEFLQFARQAAAAEKAAAAAGDSTS